MMRLDARRIRKFHRTMSIMFVLSLLASAGSGVLHSVMSRTQSPPPKARPSVKIDPTQIKVSIQEACSKLPSRSGGFDAVSVRSISGAPWYQFLVHGNERPLYVNAISGQLDEKIDERYAGEIASNFLAGAKVRKEDFLTKFNSEYISIYRILPVYRFDADDAGGTRVYVSTMTGSVTRDTNNRKQFEADVFSNVHKFMFIKNKDVRDFTLAFMTLGVFFAGILGIVLFFLTSRRSL